MSRGFSFLFAAHSEIEMNFKEESSRLELPHFVYSPPFQSALLRLSD